MFWPSKSTKLPEKLENWHFLDHNFYKKVDHGQSKIYDPGPKNQHGPKVTPIEKLDNFAGGRSKKHIKSL